MKYVYHVMCESRNHTFDGIVTTEDKIDSLERYYDIKKSIAGLMESEYTELSIKSLSFLHTVDDDFGV